MKIIKNYKFTALWISQILSQVTVNILSFTILIKLFEETHSSIATSFLWISYAIPAIIVGPFAAAFIDMVDKRKALVISNLLQAIIVLLYSIFLYKKLIFFSYAVVFLFSLFNQFYVPAESAALPLLVNKDDLPQANGLFFITQQSALVIGFGLAGFLTEFLGFRPTIVVASIGLFVAFISVYVLPKIKSKNKLPSEFEEGVKDFFDQIVEGYRFIKDTNKVLLPFLLLLGLQVVLAILVINLPAIALDILRISPQSSGFFIVMPAGIGAVIGTILVPKLLANGMRKRKLIFISLFVVSLVFALIPLMIPLITMYIVRVAFAAILFASAGISVVCILIPSITYLQQSTPKELLGRVFGNFWFLTTLITVLPVFFSGTITEIFGVGFLLLIVSAFCFGGLIFSRYQINKI